MEQDNDGFDEGKSKSEIESAHDSALMPFNNPLLHQHLLKMASKNFIYIDDISANEVITGEFSTKEAKTQIASFKDFLATHKDKLEALQIIYTQSYAKAHLTRNLINELQERLKLAELGIANLWNAYALTRNSAQTKPVKPLKSTQIKLTNLIQLVRFELGFDDELRDFASVANSRLQAF